MAISIKIAEGFGLSMSPVIEPGDMVYYKEIKNGSEIKRGDIVIFSKDKKLIAHRYISRKADFYICKGDNLLVFDAPVNRNAIQGKVILIKKTHNSYDLTTPQSRVYMWYCLVYSLSLYGMHFIAIFIVKLVFKGKRMFLYFLKTHEI